MVGGGWWVKGRLNLQKSVIIITVFIVFNRHLYFSVGGEGELLICFCLQENSIIARVSKKALKIGTFRKGLSRNEVI